MASRYKPETVLAECERIARVWTDNPTFSLGEVTLVSLKAKMADLREKQEKLAELRMQESTLSNEVDGLVGELAKIRTRGLSGLRAVFGPNSIQYELGGGTREDDRRKATRKGGDGDGNSSK